LMESAALAEFAKARAVAPASQNAALIFDSLLVYPLAPVIELSCSGAVRFPSRHCFWIAVFCARNGRSAASMNRRLLVEPLAQCMDKCTIVRIRRQWQEL
jgi:hypothetical protein